MSILFPYKTYTEVGEFYESIQSLQNGFDGSEGFGKRVFPQIQHNDLRQVPCTHQDFPTIMSHEDGHRHSFSAHSFQGIDTETPLPSKRKTLIYKFDDPSTKGSLSSYTSMSSHISLPSSTNCGNVRQKGGNVSKSKSKPHLVKKKTGEVSYRQKYKTEPCKYWTEKGYCEFGDQCAFAHGDTEVRQKSHISSNYKTKKCNQFHETGYCPYGIRCQFVHSLRKDCQINSLQASELYSEVLENADLWLAHDPYCICMQKKTRARLPSFQLYSTDDNSSTNDEKRENESGSEKGFDGDNEIPE